MKFRFLLLALAAGTASVLHATTIIPPRNLGELARESHALVLAEAQASTTTRPGTAEPTMPPGAGGGIAYTTTEFLVLETIAGAPSAGSRIQVEAPGGAVGQLEWKIPGSPRFAAGETYLLHLQKKTNSLWITSMLAYGLLQERRGKGGVPLLAPLPEAAFMHAMPRPGGETAEGIVPYRKEALLAHLREVVVEEAAWNGSLVAALPDELSDELVQDGGELVQAQGGALSVQGGAGGVPAGCFYFNSGGSNWRQSRVDSGQTLVVYGNYPGDPSIRDGGFRQVQEALQLWMNVSRTGCNLLFGGARRTNPACGGQGDFILFDDPCNDIGDLSGCGGVLAFGGGAGGGTHTFDGTAWITMQNWFVVMNNGVGCLGTGNYRILLAHELGHGLGFNHASDGGALMFGTCCNSINATDRTCVRYTYPSPDPNNERPVVDAGPSRTLTLLGDTTLLRGAVTDDGLPDGGRRLSTSWRFLAGPAEPLIGSESSLETTVTFPASGRYLVGLVAHDGELLTMDQLVIDVSIFSSGREAMTFQQGVDGYAQTVDTMLVEADPGADHSAAAELNVDGDDPGGSSQQVQVLLRFDGLFGTGRDQVMPGSPIRSARLELAGFNAGSGAELYRMRDEWEAASAWSTFGGDGIQAGVETHVLPDAIVLNPPDEPISIDVTASVAAWARSPCVNHGWALLPLGDNGWDFDSSEGDTPPRLVIEPASLQRDTAIAMGDSWEYFKGTRQPPADWHGLDFTPGRDWLSGPTGIGYGDDDDATVLGDMRGEYLSVFCRREFLAGGDVTAATLRLRYDDGFVAYLNGVEVARSASMAGRSVAFNEPSGSHEAGSAEEFRIEGGAFRPGRNILAVQVHNTTVDSSDLSFSPELTLSFLLFSGNSEWRFWRGSSPVPDGWMERAFDDSDWEVGQTSIGYGDEDDVTELADMEDNYLAVFCRREFEIRNAANVDELLLTLLYDDGVVVHVNGTEVARLNMPAGAVSGDTEASGASEPTTAAVTIPGGLLVSGRNVIAVSVHNAGISSSDLTFDAALSPRLRPLPGDCGVPFRRGDVSGDGGLNIADPIALLNSIFGGGVPSTCRETEDVNNDASVDIADPVYLLNYLFSGGRPPPDPGPDVCGLDADPAGSPGDLGCEAYDPAGC